MRPGSLIIPLGITTYLLVVITVFSGIKGIKLPYHKLLAALTLIAATLHAALVIYIYVF